MIRPLEDEDIEFIRLHYKIGNKELGSLMGMYNALVKEEGKEIRNLCFYEWPTKIVKVFGTSDCFVDYLEETEGLGLGVENEG